MSRVITFSTKFPSYHPRAGEPTYFVEKIWKGFYPEDPDDALFNHECASIWSVYKEIYESLSPKYHTIRAGHRFNVGDWFSPRIWSGKPYHSKQIIIAPDIQVQKVWDLSIIYLGGVDCIRINNEPFGQFHPLAKGTQNIAKNDGLTAIELIQWFSNPCPIREYQIICWNSNIEY